MTKTDLGNANNEKIEDLNLVALRKYACAKVNGQSDWYMKCVDCGSGCSVGKRVQDILEKDTSPNMHMVADSDTKFEEALKHDDPAQWLFENHYYSSRDSAAAQIRKYKYRNGIKTNNSDVIRRRNILNSQKGAEKRVLEMRRNIIQMFENTNTDEEKIAAILRVTKPTTLSSTIYGKAYRWAKDYPDLEERFHFFKPMKWFGISENYHLTVEQLKEKILGKEQPEEDEVSVEDFLKEEEPAPEIPVNKEMEAKKEMLKNFTESNEQAPHAGPVSPGSTQLVLRSEFGRKKQELRKRIGYIEGEIEKMSKQKAELTRQMSLLDQTAELFGMRSTT